MGKSMQDNESYARLAANHAQSWEIQAAHTVPGLQHADKTFEHLFRCSHSLMKKVVTEGKAHLLNSARSSRINKEVLEEFMHCIECGITGQDAPIPTFIPELREAVRDQNTICTQKLLQGYMAKSWVTAMKSANVKRPHQCTKTLQRLLWDILFQKVWDTRNHILHHTPNMYQMPNQLTFRNDYDTTATTNTHSFTTTTRMQRTTAMK
jgi:hypothetical protein